MASCGVCWLRFTLKPYIPETFERWPFFDPKSRVMTSLKRPIIKNLLTDFAKILFVNAKLMLNKVQEVSRRYMPF